jgi:hypothetical protein
MTPVIFFLHIPKTAGTSLRQLFQQQYPSPELVELYPPLGPESLARVRSDLEAGGRAVFGHLNFGIDRVLGVKGKYVTLLRDPVDRIVSYFSHNLRHPQAAYYELLSAGMGLREFLARRISFETNNHMTRIVAGNTSLEYLDDDRVLDQALENLREHFLFAGISERFDESVQVMARRLNWSRPLPKTNPRVNVLPKSNAPRLDRETIDLIERENRLDRLLYQAVAARLDAS